MMDRIVRRRCESRKTSPLASGAQVRTIWLETKLEESSKKTENLHQGWRKKKTWGDGALLSIGRVPESVKASVRFIRIGLRLHMVTYIWRLCSKYLRQEYISRY